MRPPWPSGEPAPAQRLLLRRGLLRALLLLFALLSPPGHSSQLGLSPPGTPGPAGVGPRPWCLVAAVSEAAEPRAVLPGSVCSWQNQDRLVVRVPCLGSPEPRWASQQHVLGPSGPSRPGRAWTLLALGRQAAQRPVPMTGPHGDRCSGRRHLRVPGGGGAPRGPSLPLIACLLWGGRRLLSRRPSPGTSPLVIV